MAALPIHWSTLALDRVIEAAEYAGGDDQKAVGQFVDGLFAATERMQAFPKSGRIVPELRRADMRQVFFRRYRTIYKVTPERIGVLTVRHMRQRFDEDEIRD